MRDCDSSTLDGDWKEHPVPAAWYVAVCGSCDNILVYSGWAEGCIPGEQDFGRAVLMWPKDGRLHPAVPPTVSAIYEEAFRVKDIAPNAFAVQIRKALEAICDERTAPKGSLYNRLKNLADRGDIPPGLAETADILRLVGNAGAHAGNAGVHSWHVATIDDFFRTLIEYLYVAPSKLEEFRRKLDDFRAAVARQSGDGPA